MRHITKIFEKQDQITFILAAVVQGIFPDGLLG